VTDDQFRSLGRRTAGPVDASGLDTFPTPAAGVDHVTLETPEVTAYCPVTGQPDYYRVAINYGPRERCLETKSLKRYLEGFRDKRVFAEALAGVIRRDVEVALDPEWIIVTVQQSPRGGITLTARSGTNAQPAGVDGG
jgi:7-cyano-7-deazaguanine reductase